MATSGKRPFWMHQGAEYLIGVAFIAQGLQSPTPLVPGLLGGLVLLNTASAKGPMAAFRLFGRRTHRLLDAVLILFTIFGAVQPFVSIESGTRMIMGLMAFALAFIWLLSDFAEKAKVPKQKRGSAAARPTSQAARPLPNADAGLAASVGRTAGRLVGGGVNAYRKRKG